ncbi:MAG: PLP-dependent aminotransferase family protein [Anaerolineales bacterium]
MSKPIVQTYTPPDFIDLGSGKPSLELLPIGMLEKAAERYFSAGDTRTLQYGAEQGNDYFLAALADFLSSMYKSDVHPDSIFTTTGASSALDLLCTLFTEPGDTIFVEEPTYFLALDIFADHRVQIVSIPMDREGMDVEKLAERLTEVQPKFVYTIPTYHNPASLILAQSRREKLVNLAREFDFLVIADEVYHFLSYTQKPPKPLAAFSDQVKQVISINSFSKILAPGLRLGWIQAHRSIINQLTGCGLLDSGGGLNPFTSAIVYQMIVSGDLIKNIKILKNVYQKRLEVMTDALDRYLPEAKYIKPQGGFFFWVQLPGIDTTRLRKRAQSFKIDFRPGELFSRQNGLKEFIRLSFSYYNPAEIENGIKQLVECLYRD